MNKGTNKYPRFIPDIPVGEDCFEGHSQEKLALSLCDYIKLQDDGRTEDNPLYLSRYENSTDY